MTLQLHKPDGKGGLQKETVGLRNAMNEVLREAYVRDCEIGLKRWNMQIQKGGHEFRLKLPSTRFRRSIGAWTNVPADLEGRIVFETRGEEDARRSPAAK